MNKSHQHFHVAWPATAVGLAAMPLWTRGKGNSLLSSFVRMCFMFSADSLEQLLCVSIPWCPNLHYKLKGKSSSLSQTMRGLGSSIVAGSHQCSSPGWYLLSDYFSEMIFVSLESESLSICQSIHAEEKRYDCPSPALVMSLWLGNWGFGWRTHI